MKNYEKPTVIFESFEMNSAITACYYDMNLQTTDVCEGYVKGEDELHFVDINTACTTTNNGSYCIEQGTSNLNLFNS